MKEKKVTKISLSTFFLILAIIIIIVMGVLIYRLSTDLQKKINSIPETSNSDNSVQTTSNVAENNLSKIDSGTQTKLKIKYNVQYDKISAIKSLIEFQEQDNIAGQVSFENNGRVFIYQNVVYGLSGTYTISGDSIICTLTSIEGEDQKTECNYTVKYKILHSNALEVINSNLDDIYHVGDLLINYTES